VKKIIDKAMMTIPKTVNAMPSSSAFFPVIKKERHDGEDGFRLAEKYFFFFIMLIPPFNIKTPNRKNNPEKNGRFSGNSIIAPIG
jgi:hypothetical protein